MEDLFEREQHIFDSAVQYADKPRNGGVCEREMFESLTQEYGILLKRLRKVTKLYDRTTVDFNATKLDLFDKAYYDALTGIYNRRFMEENLKRIIKSMSRSGGMLSVLMLDVDFFKKYNDTYGHNSGDDCLKAIAGAIQNGITRVDDFAARYGGEEFIVVLPNTGVNGACLIAEKLLKTVLNLNIPHEKNSVASCVTISIGVTTGNVKYPVTGEDYIKRADEALYISKQNGRNQCTFINLEEDKH